MQGNYTQANLHSLRLYLHSLRRRANARNVSTSFLPYGDITYLINSFDYRNLLCFNSPPTQHQSSPTILRQIMNIKLLETSFEIKLAWKNWNKCFGMGNSLILEFPTIRHLVFCDFYGKTSCLYPGTRFSKVLESYRARKAISKTMKRLMCRSFYFNRFCM